MSKRNRYIWIGLSAVAILAAFAGGWSWARRYVHQQVSAQLHAATESPVAVGRVQLGLRHHSVQGIQIRGQDGNGVWLTANELTFDLPFWEALLGDTRPRHPVLDRVEVRLDFDENGQLITRLPVPSSQVLPADEIDVLETKLTVRQPHRETLTVQVPRLEVRQQAGTITASSQATLSLDATWVLNARLDVALGTGRVEVSTTDLSLDSRTLARIPLAPSGLANWNFSGQSQLRGTVAWDRASPEWKYTLNGHVAEGILQLPSRPESLERIAASLRVSDGVAEFEIERAEWKSGRLNGRGEITVRQFPWNGQFTSRVQDLPLNQLANVFSGADVGDRLQGSASAAGEFSISMSPDGWRVEGTAHGATQDTTFGKQPVESVTFELDLDADQPAAAVKPDIQGELRADIRLAKAQLPALVDEANDWLGENNRIPPVKLAGTVDVNSRLTLPIGSEMNLLSASFQGTSEANNIEVAGVALPHAEFSFNYGDKRLRVSPYELQIGGGNIRGELTANLAAPGNVEWNAELQAVSITDLIRGLPAEWVPEELRLSGQARGSSPLDSLARPETWSADGVLLVSSTAGRDVSTPAGRVPFAIQNGSLVVRDLSGTIRDTRFEGAIQADLGPPKRFSLEGSLFGLNLNQIGQVWGDELPAPLNGRADLTGTFRGNWESLTMTGSGNGTLRQVTLGETPPANGSFEWTLSDENLQVSKAQFSWSGGQVSLSAGIPVNTPGIPSVTGTFSEVDLAPLNQFLPAADNRLAGLASGTLQITGGRDLASTSAEVHFEGPTLSVSGIPLEGLAGVATLHDEKWTAKVEGRSLGGQLSLESQPAGLQPVHQQARDERGTGLGGRLRLKDAELSALPKVLTDRLSLPPMQGRVDLDLEIQFAGANLGLTGTGTASVRNLMIAGSPVADQLSATIELLPDRLRLSEIQGTVAQGELSGEVTVPLKLGSAAGVSMSLRHASLEQLVNLVPGQRIRDVSGLVSVEVRGSGAEVWRGTAQVQVPRGRFHRVPVSSVNAPVRWEWQRRSGQLSANVLLRDAQISGGRVVGEGDFRWDGRLTASGKARVQNLDVAPLARTAAGVSDALVGRLSGNVSFSGNRMRSINDLSGTYEFTLMQSQALLLPVVAVLTRSLGATSPSGTTFTATSLKGAVNHGIVRIERMTMESPDYRLWLAGTVRMNGALDMDVTADVLGLNAVAVASGFIRPIDLLRRRLIFLNIGGRVNNPIVRPRIEAFLEQECLYFFLPVIPIPTSPTS